MAVSDLGQHYPLKIGARRSKCTTLKCTTLQCTHRSMWFERQCASTHVRIKRSWKMDGQMVFLFYSKSTSLAHDMRTVSMAMKMVTPDFMDDAEKAR